MEMIQRPKKWAFLVAIGPAAIVVGALALAALAIGLPAMELVLLAMLLNILALPAVLAGIWLDCKVVRAETGVNQRAWVWNLFAVFFAPLVGTVYLYHRRQWFQEAV